MPERLDCGSTLLASVGAIGSALLYLADMVPLQGELTLLDRDTVEASNLNRLPLFLAPHAVFGVEQTHAARDYLSHRGIAIQAVTGIWHERRQALAQSSSDVWLHSNLWSKHGRHGPCRLSCGSGSSLRGGPSTQ
jgi:hypothetical protein